jgi:hypothetical protein
MVIVDANNVLHAWGDGVSPGGVVRLLEAAMNSRYASRGVVMVCDGSAGRLDPAAQGALVRLMASHGGGGCRVVYAGPEREADDVIEGMIASAADAGHLLVVSTDARLKRAAFRAGATAMRSAEFLGHLEKDRSKMAARAAPASAGLDAGSVAWWMRYFGFAGPVAREGEGASSPASKKIAKKLEAARAAAAPSRHPPTPARLAGVPAAVAPTDDWMQEAARMWPGMFDPAELDMERVLAKQPLPKRRRKR